MPIDPSHPDPEQLTAWQAGELPGLDGARVEAHLAGCAECARLVAMAERGRLALRGLPEVEPPAGLHQRLAAALERELEAGDGIRLGHRLGDGSGLQERRLAADAAEGDGLGESPQVAEPVPLAGRRHRRRPRDRRMVALLSAAAAVILLVAGMVPLLRHLAGQGTVTAGGAATAAQDRLASGAAGSLPVFSAPNGYSAGALRSALASNPEVRSAYQRAVGVRAESGSGPQSLSRKSASGTDEGTSTTPPGSSADAVTGRRPSGVPAPAAPAGVQQSACVANARNQPGGQGLRPAFFVDTVYRGRPASVLVTVRPGGSDQADLWAFPRGNCSSPPFAHEQVTVTPP